VIEHLAAEIAQEAEHERAAARAVDVVVAEHRDRLAGAGGAGQPLGRRLHVDEHRRVGHQRAERRVEEMHRILDADAARREQAADDLRYAVALGDAEPDARLAVAPDPAPPAQAARDVEHRPRHRRRRSPPPLSAARPHVAGAQVLRSKLWCAST
jgi:hypothetical protein